MSKHSIIAALVVAAAPAWAQPQPLPPPGAEACSGCHLLHGKGNTGMPSLAGLSAEDIAAAMRAFQAGQREPTVMDRIAKGFTEEEIRAIAAWIVEQRREEP